MHIHFKKYQGTGNDFIMVNNMTKSIQLNAEQIALLCHRKFGIGADGIILIEPDSESDFYVNYYNSDGSQSFCGNGSRCSVAFAKHEGIILSNQCSFNAIDGVHSGEILENDEVKVSMGDVSEIEKLNGDSVLNTGSPHYVKHCNALTELDIITEAHKIRNNERFKNEGINVNFVEVSEHETVMRTYERGVEDETLSCGTGVTAVALSLAEDLGRNLFKLRTMGGAVGVEFMNSSQGFHDIFLLGAAEKVFEGEVHL